MTRRHTGILEAGETTNALERKGGSTAAVEVLGGALVAAGYGMPALRMVFAGTLKMAIGCQNACRAMSNMRGSE